MRSSCVRSCGHVVRHHDLERVALARADHRERDAGVARGRLEDRLAGRDQAVLLGALDQRARDAVLDRAGRVVALELGVDAHAGLGAEATQLDERRVADRLDDVAVLSPARPVVEPWLQGFRKCSTATRSAPCPRASTPGRSSRAGAAARRRWSRACAAGPGRSPPCRRARPRALLAEAHAAGPCVKK